jgi:hypothetical protein
VLRLIDDDDGRGPALIDHLHESALDVGPQDRAPVRRLCPYGVRA